MEKENGQVQVKNHLDSNFCEIFYCSGASECKPCSPGKKCAEATNSKMLPCDIGFECSNPAKPRECQPGTKADSQGLAKCEDCPAGYNCFNPKEPFICPAGTHVIDGAREHCENCKAGHYCLDGIMNECGTGKYAPSNSSSCTECEPGRNCTKSTLSEPENCRIGFACKDPAKPELCPEGTLANEFNQIDCQPCPKHHNCIQPTKPISMLATKINATDLSNSSCFHHRILMKSKEFHSKEVIEVITEVSSHWSTGFRDK